MVTSVADYKAKLTATVTLPSGAEFTLRRPPLHIWKQNGRIPSSFTALQIQAMEQGIQATEISDIEKRVRFELKAVLDAQRRISALPEAEQKALDKFEREVVLASVVAPKITELPGTGALSLEDITAEDFRFIFEYAMNNSPGVAVPTQEGATTTQAVQTFRAGTGRQRAAHARNNVRKVQRKAKR